MKPDALMIFAAGLGTRMGELTRTRPKPLIEVAGKPLLAHALELAETAGIDQVVVNTHAHAEQMHDYVRAHAPHVKLSHEPERLETGGGLKNARRLLPDAPVYTLNADMVWRGSNPLDLLGKTWNPAQMDALLCLLPRRAAQGHSGVGDFFADTQMRLTRRGTAAQADYVYAGAQIIRHTLLDTHPAGAFSLNEIWDQMIARNRLYGVVYGGDWIDVGRPENIALAEAALLV